METKQPEPEPQPELEVIESERRYPKRKRAPVSKYQDEYDMASESEASEDEFQPAEEEAEEDPEEYAIYDKEEDAGPIVYTDDKGNPISEEDDSEEGSEEEEVPLLSEESEEEDVDYEESEEESEPDGPGKSRKEPIIIDLDKTDAKNTPQVSLDLITKVLKHEADALEELRDLFKLEMQQATPQGRYAAKWKDALQVALNDIPTIDYSIDHLPESLGQCHICNSNMNTHVMLTLRYSPDPKIIHLCKGKCGKRYGAMLRLAEEFKKLSVLSNDKIFTPVDLVISTLHSSWNDAMTAIRRFH